MENDTIIDGKTLYRIEALKDFSVIKKGDKGGYIEKEENLSHNYTCWVYDNAKVYGNARIYLDARISGCALLYGDARLYDNAFVNGNAKVYGNAKLYDSKSL